MSRFSTLSGISAQALSQLCKPTVTALAVSAAAAALSGAPTAVSAEESIRTEAVQVTASRVERELLDVPMSVSVVTREELERETGKTVADFLDQIPGVEVMNDGSQGLKRLKIRGENAFRTLVMIDGQKVSEHKSMSGTPILIDPSQIERIEVIKGPASVLYGSDAIGGAVNIITKKGGVRPVEGYVTGGLDTSGSGKTAAGGVSGRWNGWSYRLNASTSSYGELETPVGKAANTEFSNRSGSAYLAYDLTENITVGGSLDSFDLKSKSGDQIDILEGKLKDFWVDIPEWKRTKGALFVDMKNLTDHLVRLRADVFRQRTIKQMENLVQPSITMRNYADNTLDQTGVSVQSDWQLGEHYLIAGYEYSHDDLAAASRFTISPMSGMIVSDTNEIYDAQMDTHALYLSAESPVTEAVRLNYGVRYTYVSGEADMRGSQKTMGSAQSTYGASHDSSDGHAVFNAGALWRLTDDLALRATWAQGYRYPTMQELYIDTEMGGGIAYSNPDLKPETSNNFEAGLRWTGDLANVDAAVFFTKAEDYITALAQDATGVTTRFENVGEATTYGLEGTVSLTSFPYGIEPYANLTLMRRKFEQNGFSTYDSGTPEITVRYGVKWSRTVSGLDLSTNLYADTMSGTKSSNLDPENETITRVGGATTFNLTGGIAFGPEKRYSLDAGFYNITDKLYTKSGAIYEAGRSAAVKFNAKF